MRIATSTLYNQQIQAIDNQQAQEAIYSNQSSTGKKLNNPSDDPTQIARDLFTRTSIDVTNTNDQNVANSISELTVTESTIGSLTAVLQSARTLAIQGASDALSPAQQSSIGDQVDALLKQAVALGNTEYAGKYIFAGTNNQTVPPVQAIGSPISSVKFAGNFASQDQYEAANGEQITLSTTVQQAFNFNATDGSLDVYQTLINLRNSLKGGTVTTIDSKGTTVVAPIIDQSSAAINASGKVASPTATLAALGNTLATPLTTDSSGNITIRIDGGAGGATLTFNPAVTTIDNGTPTSIVAQINASGTGVSATFDAKTQKLTLSSSQPFEISDQPSAGAGTTTGNFLNAFGITQQADVVGNLSRQLVDIDKVLSQNLSARAVVGTNVQTLTSLKDQFNTSITNQTAVQSGIEDASIPDTTAAFTLSQTVLQAAYATTTRLESKTLFDYL